MFGGRKNRTLETQVASLEAERAGLRQLLAEALGRGDANLAVAEQMHKSLTETTANSRRLLAHANTVARALDEGRIPWRPIAELEPLARETAARAGTIEVELARAIEPHGSWRYLVAHISAFGMVSEGPSCGLLHLGDSLAPWTLWRPHSAPQAGGRAEAQRGLEPSLTIVRPPQDGPASSGD